MVEIDEKALLDRATTVARNAYAPYSRLSIGAAILTEAGEIYAACNVENHSYGLSMCAERSAVFAAVAAEGSNVRIMAVALASQPAVACSPCGACRQVMAEFGPAATVIYPAGRNFVRATLIELLPHQSGYAPETWMLASGERVVDRAGPSHLHDGVHPFLPEVLQRIRSAGRDRFTEVIDVGRVIGESLCVVTGPDDEIVYAKRVNREGHTRFVLNRSGEPCSSVFVALKRSEVGDYVLLTAFIGEHSELEPWDPNATDASRRFWDCHALLWGREPTVLETLTTVRPW